MAVARHDYDWLVIGSGFGGSTSALRLAQKGSRVAVLECGRRFADEDFAKTTWELGRYYWMPKLRLKGIFRLTLFKDVLVASGCGVGGGSLGYANTLYRARPAFYRDPQIAELGDWEHELAPHYEEAEADARRDHLRPGHAGGSAAEGTRSRTGSATPIRRPAWACSWARRERRCRIRSSAARARSAPAACGAASA
jgi:choline dehydrogenase-like flavoprotein